MSDSRPTVDAASLLAGLARVAGEAKGESRRDRRELAESAAQSARMADDTARAEGTPTAQEVDAVAFLLNAGRDPAYVRALAKVARTLLATLWAAPSRDRAGIIARAVAGAPDMESAGDLCRFLRGPWAAMGMDALSARRSLARPIGRAVAVCDAHGMRRGIDGIWTSRGIRMESAPTSSARPKVGRADVGTVTLRDRAQESREVSRIEADALDAAAERKIAR